MTETEAKNNFWKEVTPIINKARDAGLTVETIEKAFNEQLHHGTSPLGEGRKSSEFPTD